MCVRVYIERVDQVPSLPSSSFFLAVVVVDD